jgi:molecular chaperone DnaJ
MKEDLMSHTELYDALGVSPEADQEEIRRAYKKMALKYHPDKNPEDPDKFKDITHAYAILSDDEKRAVYDASGRHDGGPSVEGPSFHNLFTEIFSDLPFGFFSFPQQQQHTINVRPDEIEITMSISEVYHGTVKHVEYEALELCSQCHGSCAASMSDVWTCVTCNGSGQVQNNPLPFVVTVEGCQSCGGRGRVVKRPCVRCNGEGTVYAKRAFEIRLPRGLSDGHIHTLPGKGSYDVGAKCARDMVLRFNYDFTEDGVTVDGHRNVHMTIGVGLEDVLCGFKRVLSLYGKSLSIVAPHYFDPTKTTMVPGWGLPDGKGSSYADLHITFNVIYPNDDRCVRYQAILCKLMKRQIPQVEDSSAGDTVRIA